MSSRENPVSVSSWPALPDLPPFRRWRTHRCLPVAPLDQSPCERCLRNPNERVPHVRSTAHQGTVGFHIFAWRRQSRKSSLPPRVSRKMINGGMLSPIETLAVQRPEGIKEGGVALDTRPTQPGLFFGLSKRSAGNRFNHPHRADPL